MGHVCGLLLLSITRRLSEAVHCQAVTPRISRHAGVNRSMLGRRGGCRRGEERASALHGQTGESPRGEGRFVLGKKFRKKMRHSLPSAKVVVTNARGSISGKSFLLLWEFISESLFSKFTINVKKKEECFTHGENSENSSSCKLKIRPTILRHKNYSSRLSVMII